MDDFPSASLFIERPMDCPHALWNETISVQ
jgi:hypothetical protein